MQNIASLDATTTATIESAVANAPNTFTDLNISGLSTFAGITTVTGETLFTKQLGVSGVSTFAGITTVTGVSLFTRQLSISGVSTFAGITTHTASLFGTQGSFSGIVTANSFRPSSGYIQAADGTNSFFIYSTTGNVAFQGTIGASQLNSASGNKVIGLAGTDATFENNVSVSGVSTFAGITTVTGSTLFAKQLNVSGVTTITGNLNAAGNYYVKLARLTNQTIANGADALIGFSAVSDPNSWYSGITTRTTPTVAGTYHVDVMLNWAAGTISTDQTNIQLRKNGNTFALSQVGIRTFGYTQNACGIVTLNGTTDYIDFTVYTANPTSQVVTGTADGAWTKMEIFKIN